MATPSAREAREGKSRRYREKECSETPDWLDWVDRGAVVGCGGCQADERSEHEARATVRYARFAGERAPARVVPVPVERNAFPVQAAVRMARAVGLLRADGAARRTFAGVRRAVARGVPSDESSVCPSLAHDAPRSAMHTLASQ